MFSAPVFSLGDNTLLELYNYLGHNQPQPSNNSKMSHLFIPDIFVWSTDFGAEQNAFKTSDFRDTGSIHFSRIPCRSRSLFLGGWRRFELINKESGGEGSDGKGKKRDTWSRKLSSFSPFISHHAPLVLCACSHHPKLTLLARLQHPALKVCALHWALGEEGWGKEYTATTNAKTLETILEFITISNVWSGSFIARYTQ